ncbi:Maf family protein [Amphiplicatus metriothermophilus]|uniref:Nucleoside triphosphate pyrophosphatase n=1 Tax=Amphiplicatus metriothermophilus TaxID=1519374 RepID=A0A239PLP7_9PROT|nr:Maf family protein [Amphiplicatus metriothermophilus]MBB5517652.1 septum formation protein [Amphiplicatus metriothermophilus]SNT68014.1 septum formation protein [Amphiplicatus metriothermophilus]
MPRPIVLASGSAIRARILKDAGLAFEIVRPETDEAAIKRAGIAEGLDIETLAMRLAEAKARAVRAPARALVVGADQILEFEGRPYDKPASLAEARARLKEWRGRTHTLINAVAVAEDGAIVFRHLDRPRLSMRALTDGEIDRYLEAAGPGILASVGAYQVESLGARLFDRIEGDYFAVLGLSLLPLLGFLRRAGALDF